jgi:hypothetical protein
MKQERRKLALQHYLLQIRQSIEREQKGREGIVKYKCRTLLPLLCCKISYVKLNFKAG